jgi:hypothetical protein
MVKWRKGEEEAVENFEAVVVCNGHYFETMILEIPGWYVCLSWSCSWSTKCAFSTPGGSLDKGYFENVHNKF